LEPLETVHFLTDDSTTLAKVTYDLEKGLYFDGAELGTNGWVSVPVADVLWFGKEITGKEAFAFAKKTGWIKSEPPKPVPFDDEGNLIIPPKTPTIVP
jgi:hypothetical protein